MGGWIGKVSAPLLTTVRKALNCKAFETPKALHISPMSAYSVTGLTPPLLFGTIRTVFRPVGFWQIGVATEDTFLHVSPVEQSGIQPSVQRQDSGAEPLADQRVCDTLRTDTFLAVIQQETAPAVIVTTAMYQPPGGAVLLILSLKERLGKGEKIW